MFIYSSVVFQEGYTGKSALRKYFCMPCQANFTSVFAWEEHRKSAAHVEKAGDGDAAATATETPPAAGTTESGETTKEGEGETERYSAHSLVQVHFSLLFTGRA